MSLYPFLLEPALHVSVWGGRQLETVLHKRLPKDEPYAEAWEVHDTATIINGALAGRRLRRIPVPIAKPALDSKSGFC